MTVLAPNCFYYQVDLFRKLANNPNIDLTVCFCSGEGLESKDLETAFGVKAVWGVGEEMLEGYNHKFLKNYSPAPSYRVSLIGLMNLGIWFEIRKGRPDVVILMSWMNPTSWLSVLACLTRGIPFLLMTDSNVATEFTMSRIKGWARKWVLGRFLFSLCSGFLCSGLSNKEVYRAYNVPESKLFSFAFSSGYEALIAKSKEIKPLKSVHRDQNDISPDEFLILFCGRLSKEKNLFHLLDAFDLVDVPNKTLLLVGDGALKRELLEYVHRNQIESVRFVGFKNRWEVLTFYNVADVLVLPSERETWGMVVNEAMCFGVPVITSSAVGATPDLVEDGKNGFSYPSGDTAKLADVIQRIADMSDASRKKMGDASLEIIDHWANRDLGRVMLECLDSIYKN